MLWLLAVLWLGIGFWRGYLKGWVRVLANLLALFLGYVACFLWGGKLAAKLSIWLPPILTWPIAAACLFTTIALLIKLLARPLESRYSPKRQTSTAFWGAGLNFFATAVIMVSMVWALSVLAGVGNPVIAKRLALAGFTPDHALVKGSGWLVSRFIGVGLAAVGVDKPQVALGMRLAAAPAEGADALKKVSGSEQTRALMHSHELSNVMLQGDISALQQHPSFIAFAEQPGIDQLKAMAPGENYEAQNAALASAMTTVYQRVDSIKHTPEVQAAFADPEVQKLLDEGNSAALMVHPKVQPILAIVMGSLSNSAISGLQSKPGLQLKRVPTQTAAEDTSIKPILYKWRDEKGQPHFTTWDRIPNNRREGAELINL